MKLFKRLLAGLAFTLLYGFSAAVSAHGINDIRINEILVFNENNYIDTYGHRVGWIELHNTGHSSIDVGGCFLTIYREGIENAYRIPKGNPGTVIPPEGYLVFFAEGTATKGVFHTSFTLDQTGYIAFWDQSGKGKPIDEVSYNVAEQRPDISMGVIRNENGEEVFTFLDRTTPGATNEDEVEIPNSELFRMRDPTGIIMAITAMSVVFTALVLLYLIFRTIGKASVRSGKKKRAKEEAAKVPANTGQAVSVDDSADIHGEELAAIAMALYQFQNDLHDQESNVITFNKVAKAYSPWSSKIYGLRQLPNKK